MKKEWLVLDCNYLCWRAFHTARGLSHGAMGTGVLYGFFQSLVTLREEFPDSRMMFCFDSMQYNYREVIFPEYKATRKKKREQATDEEKEAFQDMRRQMKLLRHQDLKEIGFNNVYGLEGYEADDLIAALVEEIPRKDRIRIVSRDEDLYQLLSDRVSIYDPQKKHTYTYQEFKEEFYGLYPCIWPKIKAVGGCSTDDIPGVDGVAEKTAAKYFAGKTKGSTQIKIEKFMCTDQYRRNLRLVTLPYYNSKITPPIEMVIKNDTVTDSKWRKVMMDYGMRSLVGRY